MNDEELLTKFALDLTQSVIARSEVEEDEKLREDQFTELMIEYLSDAGEIEDGFVCSHQRRGLKVNGYSFSEDWTRIDLFVCDVKLDGEIYRINKTTVDTALRRLETYFQKCLDRYHLGLEESSPGFDLALMIWEHREELSQVRFFLFTDGISSIEQILSSNVGEIVASSHVWDLSRLHRCLSSGTQRETIQIDFLEMFGRPLRCLPCDMNSETYRCFFAAIPAEVLVGLYARFGPRLLERNVRSFLQARGNVNKGIRKTVLETPEMFLAFNNGISVTVEGVELVTDSDGGQAISQVRDFQIVNGGQTTGSLFNAVRKDKASLSQISVATKITEVKSADVEEIAPLISLYANSQNKVSMADFSSNNPFHVRLEELSRTIWAPPGDGMQRQTKWYYERARGQYLDDKSRESTPAKKRAFETMQPRRQVITKTDLAKYENSWGQMPHIVSRGAQKNFLVFMQLLEQRGRFTPDELYFRHLIAKAILFKQTEKLVSIEKFGGYRANIVTYTLAWLSHHTAQRIDLERIWKLQVLPNPLQTVITSMCREAWNHIINPPGGANITEWCKRPMCWDNLKDREVNLRARIDDFLIPEGQGPRKPTLGTDAPTPEELELVHRMGTVRAETWFGIAKWAKETQNLQAWQRSLAFSLGRLARAGKPPSAKQAKHGNKIMEEAQRLGFLVYGTTG